MYTLEHALIHSPRSITCSHIYSHTHTHMLTITLIHSLTHIWTHLHTCTHVHILSNSYSHILTCSHIQTHLHTCSSTQSSSALAGFAHPASHKGLQRVHPLLKLNDGCFRPTLSIRRSGEKTGDGLGLPEFPQTETSRQLPWIQAACPQGRAELPEEKGVNTAGS